MLRLASNLAESNLFQASLLVFFAALATLLWTCYIAGPMEAPEAFFPHDEDLLHGQVLLFVVVTLLHHRCLQINVRSLLLVLAVLISLLLVLISVSIEVLYWYPLGLRDKPAQFSLLKI